MSVSRRCRSFQLPKKSGPQCSLDAGHEGQHSAAGNLWCQYIASRADGLAHCYDCNRDKPLSEFQIGIRGKHTSPCLHCRAVRLRNYDASGRRPKWINKESAINASRKWAANNREKRSAYNAVQIALKSGALKRGPCSVCGATKVHAHHVDYSQKLKVVWLCHQCHKKEHRKYA